MCENSENHYRLLICRFPGNFQEHPRSAGYVMKLLHHYGDPLVRRRDQIAEIRPYTVSDTPITMSRNRAAKYALDNGFDYMLMIDSDMEPDVVPGAPPFFQTAWREMMARRFQEGEYRREQAAFDEREVKLSAADIEADVREAFPAATIAAPYCGGPPDESCFIFQWHDLADRHPPFRLGMVSRDDAAIRAGVQEVAALPTGLILYDVRLFRHLPKPWYDYEYTDEYQTEKASTEDVFQTRNASMLGFPQFVIWDCWAGHIKPKTVGKPRLITPDIMTTKLREAMTRRESNAQVRIIREEPESAVDKFNRRYAERAAMSAARREGPDDTEG